MLKDTRYSSYLAIGIALFIILIFGGFSPCLAQDNNPADQAPNDTQLPAPAGITKTPTPARAPGSGQIITGPGVSVTPASPRNRAPTPRPHPAVAHPTPRPTPRPAARPTPKPIPRPTPRPHPTARPTVARPTPTRPAPAPTAVPTPKPAPVLKINPPAKPSAPPLPAKVAGGKKPTVNPEDAPIEDQPIPDVAPVVPGSPAPAGSAATANPAPAAPAPATANAPVATPGAASPATAPGAVTNPANLAVGNAITKTGQPPKPGAPGIHAPAPTGAGQTTTQSATQSQGEEFAGDQINGTANRNIFDVWGTFQIDFMRKALWAGLLVALMCSYLGIYVVLKRIVFVGVALAEVSSAGIALAILLNFAPLLGALGFMLLGVVLFSIHWSPRRVPHESYIGILYSVAAALSILLIAKSAAGEAHMLTLLQGDILTISAEETRQMLGAFIVVGLLHALFYKEFVFVSFDRESANTLGFRAAAWDLLLFLTIGLTIAFSIRSVGVLLTSTMLIIPASTALLITSRMRHAWLLVPFLGALPVILGLHISLIADLPASAVIVAASFVLFLPALFGFLIRQRG